jgi:hypothetical protein
MLTLSDIIAGLLLGGAAALGYVFYVYVGRVPTRDDDEFG